MADDAIQTPKARRILEMAQEASTCPACDLAQTRTKVVFGDGNADSPLMLVGEGPGQNEDRSSGARGRCSTSVCARRGCSASTSI